MHPTLRVIALVCVCAGVAGSAALVANGCCRRRISFAMPTPWACSCTHGPFAASGDTSADSTGESPAQEYLQFYCLGIDGLFSDFPDAAVSARELLHLVPGSFCRTTF